MMTIVALVDFLLLDKTSTIVVSCTLIDFDMRLLEERKPSLPSVAQPSSGSTSREGDGVSAGSLFGLSGVRSL
jgi:hypothetical protein